MKRTAVLGACLAAALAAGGCKTTHVAFVNDTDTERRVTLEGPGEISPTPATLPVAAGGGRAIFTITTPSSQLPANYPWVSNDRRGNLAVSRGSASERVILISNGQEVAPDHTFRVTPQPR